MAEESATYPLPNCKTTIEPDDVEWDMDWSGMNADGTRRHPNKPEKERQFEASGALALLLLNEAVFLNSHWWQEEWPEEARKGTSINVNCNDVFAWGCADAEPANYDELESVYQHWKKDPSGGTEIWCMIKRRELPQRPVLESIKKSGLWDIAALTAAHGLRDNHYDGVSMTLARQKYAAYAAWAAVSRADVMPFDGRWWTGWKQFTEANPLWHSAEWEQEEDALIAQWKQDNGWTSTPTPAAGRE